MGIYEPIRGHDDAEEQDEKIKRGVKPSSVQDEDDVEMAVRGRSGTAILIAGGVGGGGGLNKIEEEIPKQKQQQQKQQRLVSLDVFRGITVAVMVPHAHHLSPLCLLFFFIFFTHT